MGRKKKKTTKPWCWYCNREFEDDKILLQHQKAKHFKCHICHKKLFTGPGLQIHCMQVHKENIEKVPNAIKGRDNIALEICGMENIPEEDLIEHEKQKLNKNRNGDNDSDSNEDSNGGGSYHKSPRPPPLPPSAPPLPPLPPLPPPSAASVAPPLPPHPPPLPATSSSSSSTPSFSSTTSSQVIQQGPRPSTVQSQIPPPPHPLMSMNPAMMMHQPYHHMAMMGMNPSMMMMSPMMMQQYQTTMPPQLPHQLPMLNQPPPPLPSTTTTTTTTTPTNTPIANSLPVPLMTNMIEPTANGTTDTITIKIIHPEDLDISLEEYRASFHKYRYTTAQYSAPAVISSKAQSGPPPVVSQQSLLTNPPPPLNASPTASFHFNSSNKSSYHGNSNHYSTYNNRY